MDITPEIIASFRVMYPLFSDFTKWPDANITMALCEGDEETGSRWRAYQDDCHNLKRRGMYLFAAHYLITTYPNGADYPNQQSWMTKNQISSKSVGDESVSFVVANMDNVNHSGNSWLASTAFGQQFVRLRKRVGMGAIAV